MAAVNHITRVAIVGAAGRVGGAFARALLQTGKHTVTALTRPDSNGTLPERVEVAKVDYEDEASIVEALRGQQFLVITLGVSARDQLHGRIVAAAAKAGVPYVMPNAYGYPGRRETGDVYARTVWQRVEDAKSHGVSSSSVLLVCGFWYEWSLALPEQWFGFTIKERKVTFFDDGKRTVAVSTWDQCGRALAALLGLAESGPSPSLADFKNGEVRISSFRVSQRDMLDSLHRVLGTTDADWDIKYEPSAKRIQDGGDEFQKGIPTGFAKQLYGGVFLPSNPFSDYAAEGTHNELLGLPKEDLDEATRRAVDMVESGWNPFL